MADQDPIREQIQQVPTVRELAMALFRQRRVFLGVAGIVLVTSFVYALVGTKYEANMKILVRRGRADAPVSGGENAPLDLTHLAVTEEELNSEVELLQDEDVLREVVAQTGLGEKTRLHFLHPGEGSEQRQERAARRLAKALRVEPVKKTNLIAVTYTAHRPELAAQVLHSLAKVYLEKHLTVHRPSGELPFFAQQAMESRRQLDDSKRELLQFSAKRGIISAGLQRDLALQKLADLEVNRRQTTIELAETRRRAAALQTQLATLPQRSTTQIRTSDNPELLKELKSSLLNLELKRTQLLTKFEPTHRLVQEVEQQITETQSAVAVEEARPLRDETTDKNTNYEWANSELQRAEVQIKSLEARELAITIEECAYRRIAGELGQDAVTQEDLVSREKAALENYLLYVKKQEEARMDDALDERGIVNAAIAQQPIAPALPVWSAWMVVAIGFVAAGASGTGVAFVADYLSPVFRDPDDAAAYLNSPVLACIPRKPCGRLSA